MRKGVVVALAVTGSLMVGPSALAATAEPSGVLPGSYRPAHAGHDHGKKDDKKKDEKKVGKPKHWHGKSDGNWDHHHHGDSAHASGGYDSHREHPRHY